MQYFKGDDTEIKFYESGKPIHDTISLAKDAFLDSAYTCKPLGELLYDNELAPLTNAIERQIFLDCFVEVINSFTVAGSFESYLSIFRTIFGNDVVVDFTVPAPGKLLIDIEATGVETHNFVADEIVSGAYEYNQMVDDVGDNLVFDNVKGFETQYEVEQMLYEFVPAGIYTEITLTIV